ncbi:HAD-like domain-containing protein [Pyronema domesticum]|nr:HAD-like domain-containing protein [Pyronema domesticum]
MTHFARLSPYLWLRSFFRAASNPSLLNRKSPDCLDVTTTIIPTNRNEATHSYIPDITSTYTDKAIIPPSSTPAIPSLHHIAPKQGCDLRNLKFFFDFDETLTISDTTESLAMIFYTFGPHSKGHPHQWSHYVRAYLDDLSAIPPLPRLTIEEERVHLRRLPAIDRASINRIISDKIFRGIQIQTICQEARNVKLRPNIGDLMDFIGDHGGHMNIVSVNWSKSWIRSALRLDVEKRKGEHDYEIYSNDLEVDESGYTTGVITDDIVGAEDKERVFEGVMKSVDHVAPEATADSPENFPIFLTIAAGDSSTDLLMLLKADLGIVVGDNLDKHLTRLRIPCMPLSEFNRQTRSRKKVLFKLNSEGDWKELIGVLERNFRMGWEEEERRRMHQDGH